MTTPTPEPTTTHTTAWFIEASRNGKWRATSLDYDTRDEALERLAITREAVPSQQYRLVRSETTETVEEA
ncbi:hypothetical protein ABZ883_14725 [Streptomyces sp. NPDC046977]|uniref:hypothetical protein n=1 Tax=Streptomyces sp. NPDC046977 TaxID=3154703 RepID=UPI00340D5AA7